MKRLHFSLLLICVLSFVAAAQGPFDGCPAKGKRKLTHKNPTGKVPVREQGLNVRKNRDAIPTTIDHTITLDSLIKAKEEPDLNFNSAAEVTAFVVSAEDGEPGESCNCGRADLKDIHIKVVAKEADKDDKTKYVVFEITPRWEGQLGDTSTVKPLIVGKWVKFTGYLTYDYKHRGNARNRKKKGNIWRATAWEVHPVTAFQVVPSP